MKLNKRKKLVALSLSAALVLTMMTGCANSNTSTGSTSSSTGNTQSGGITLADAVTAEEMPDVTFATTAQAGEEVEGDTTITLGESVTIDGKGATADGQVVTITKAGTYVITGTLSDGQIIVDTTDTDKVKLVLNGADITCSNGPAIYVKSSPKKTVIELAEGSVNLVADGKSYDTVSGVDETDQPSAAIFAMDDLKISGEGALYVTGSYKKGIFTKDDLEIEDADLYVKAADDGIRGKDSVTVTNAMIYGDVEGDGIRTSNTTDTTKGDITISGATIYLTATLDGIQAVTNLTLTDTELVIQTGGGYENAPAKSNNDMGMGGPDGSQGSQTSDTTTTTDTETTSAKGLKAGGTLTIESGAYTIDSSDDSIHSNDTAMIDGGSFAISAGDDAIHADSALVINDGNLTITTCYEGLEATDITVNNGTVRITASDDGVNGSGGNDNSGMQNQGGDTFASTGNATFTINGGYLIVNADGDGLDSNGSITMTGGVAIVYGPTNDGNGALDYDSGFSLTGGTLLALGSSGMAQSATGDGQCVAAFNANVAANTLMSITDSDGNELITVEAPKQYATVVFSSPDLESGSTYNVYTGGDTSASSSDGIYELGSYEPGDKLGDFTAE